MRTLKFNHDQSQSILLYPGRPISVIFNKNTNWIQRNEHNFTPFVCFAIPAVIYKLGVTMFEEAKHGQILNGADVRFAAAAPWTQRNLRWTSREHLWNSMASAKNPRLTALKYRRGKASRRCSTKRMAAISAEVQGNNAASSKCFHHCPSGCPNTNNQWLHRPCHQPWLGLGHPA